MQCVSSDSVDGAIRRGDLVFATAVSGANVLRDVREAVTNVVGGQMKRYEHVLDHTIARALESLKERAKDQGYDGIVSLRIVHPHITDGAIEVVVYGTGFYHLP
ncbi:MAG: heavy metal-binding domain-containing protein [Pseudomonadota bacterium]